jgi:hypothetical protein
VPPFFPLIYNSKIYRWMLSEFQAYFLCDLDLVILIIQTNLSLTEALSQRKMLRGCKSLELKIL